MLCAIAAAASIVLYSPTIAPDCCICTAGLSNWMAIEPSYISSSGTSSNIPYMPRISNSRSMFPDSHSAAMRSHIGASSMDFSISRFSTSVAVICLVCVSDWNSGTRNARSIAARTSRCISTVMDRLLPYCIETAAGLPWLSSPPRITAPAEPSLLASISPMLVKIGGFACSCPVRKMVLPISLAVSMS